MLRTQCALCCIQILGINTYSTWLPWFPCNLSVLCDAASGRTGLGQTHLSRQRRLNDVILLYRACHYLLRHAWSAVDGTSHGLQLTADRVCHSHNTALLMC